MSVIVDFRCFPVARCALFQSNCLNNILIYDLFVLSCSLEMRTTHLTFRLATALFFQIMQEVFRHTTFILREKKNFVPSYWISSRFMGKWSSSKYARTHTYGSWNFDWIIRCCISFCPFFFRFKYSNTCIARISLFWSMPSFGLRDGHSESVCTVHIRCAMEELAEDENKQYPTTNNIPKMIYEWR